MAIREGVLITDHEVRLVQKLECSLGTRPSSLIKIILERNLLMRRGCFFFFWCRPRRARLDCRSRFSVECDTSTQLGSNTRNMRLGTAPTAPRAKSGPISPMLQKKKTSRENHSFCVWKKSSGQWMDQSELSITRLLHLAYNNAIGYTPPQGYDLDRRSTSSLCRSPSEG